jgi:hypothetical protein
METSLIAMGDHNNCNLHKTQEFVSQWQLISDLPLWYIYGGRDAPKCSCRNRNLDPEATIRGQFDAMKLNQPLDKTKTS